MALPIKPVVAKTAGLVLAGGQSLRMGRNKALLPVTEQQTLLQFMQLQLQSAGCTPVLISGAMVGGLPDRVPEAGPLAGIEAALSVLADQPAIEQLLVVPVDMPALSPALLADIIAAGDGSHAVQFAGESPLPLLLPNNASTRAVVAAEMQPAARRSLRDMLAKLPTRRLPLPAMPAEVFANVNTPADWLQWQQKSDGGVV